MRTRRSLFLLPAVCVAFCGFLSLGRTDSGVAGAPRPQYREGDQAFAKRNIPEEGKKALELFRNYHAENPNDAEAGWRHAMGCYFAGLHLLTSDEEKVKVFAEGRDAGEAAIKLAPDCAPCHFWTGINMALYGQTVGAFKMLFSLAAIKEHLEATLKKEPGYAGAGSYRLLGLIEQKLPGILGGSNDRARENFEKAIQTAPDEPMNYLFLMKLLAEEFDDEEAARAIARKGLAVRPPSAEQIESIGSLKELREYLGTSGRTGSSGSAAGTAEPLTSPTPAPSPAHGAGSS